MLQLLRRKIKSIMKSNGENEKKKDLSAKEKLKHTIMRRKE
jgi:hypothetical protein